MNNLASIVNQRNMGTRNKIAKPSKNKNNMGLKKQRAPVKVVYISNPVKVKTSASQFMALVQQFTGQDAELPDPTMYEEVDLDEANINKVDVVAEDSKPERSSSTATTTATTATTTSSSEVDQVEEAPATTCYDDDEFMMLDNFSAADALASESFLWTWMS